MSNELVSIVNAQKQQFLAVVSDKTIEFDREAAFACQIIQANDYLLKIAMNNQNSLRNAVVNVAAIGISLNPASKLAYLVPRKGSVCLDISYMGLMHIAQQSGAIQWGQAALVRQHDAFELRGIDSQPLHTYNPFATDRGEIVGVYVVVKTDTGDYLTHAMPISEVYSIRDRSEAYKSGKACPWTTDPGEMIKKTCVKQAAKYWPRRDRLDSAVHHLNTDGGEGITLVEQNSLPEDEFAAFVKRIEATTTHEAAKAVYFEAAKICKELKDQDSSDRLKQITMDHRAFIDAAAVEAERQAA